MREYLIRAGIIDANSGVNGTFVEQGKDGILGSRDHRRNERVGPQRIQSGPIGLVGPIGPPRETFNSIWRVLP